MFHNMDMIMRSSPRILPMYPTQKKGGKNDGFNVNVNFYLNINKGHDI